MNKDAALKSTIVVILIICGVIGITQVFDYLLSIGVPGRYITMGWLFFMGVGLLWAEAYRSFTKGD